MRKRELIVIVVSLVLSTIAGLGAMLPPKWMVAAIVAIAVVVILLIVRDAERGLLFAVALVIPFHIGAGLPAFLTHAGHVGLSDSLDVQVMDVMVLSLLTYRLARWAIHRGEIRLYPFTTVPALAWLLTSALSAVDAREVDATVIQLGQMAKLFLLYIAVANSIEDEADVTWLVQALLLGILFQGMLGAYQSITGHPLGLSFLSEPTQLVYGRPSGTIGHPNGYGMFLAATLPMALALLFLEIRGRYKAVVGVVLYAGLLGLVFSLSRGAWLAFVVASVAVLVLATRRGHRGFKIVIAGAGSILLVVLVLVLSQQDLIISRFTSEQAQESALTRITLARGAISMIRDYPALGVGLNNYALLMPKYDPIDFAIQGRVIVHNVFLLIGAETGFVGLAAFLWFLASLFVQAKRLINEAPNDCAWLAGVGAFSAFAALTIHGMVDYDLLASLTVFRVLWLFAALVAGAGANTGHRQVAPNQSQLHEYDRAVPFPAPPVTNREPGLTG